MPSDKEYLDLFKNNQKIIKLMQEGQHEINGNLLDLIGQINDKLNKVLNKLEPVELGSFIVGEEEAIEVISLRATAYSEGTNIEAAERVYMAVMNAQLGEDLSKVVRKAMGLDIEDCHVEAIETNKNMIQ